MFGLTGRKLLIIGGGQGMGEATAAFAARAGADVVLVDIVAERAEAVAAMVAGHGRRGIRFRTMTALSRGETPGPENSIAKLVNASKQQDIASFGLDLMGQGGLAIDDDLVQACGLFQAGLLTSPSLRIAGGSDEILRNIVAERVLGLPPDIRVDKGIPFNRVPTGTR